MEQENKITTTVVSLSTGKPLDIFSIKGQLPDTITIGFNNDWYRIIHKELIVLNPENPNGFNIVIYVEKTAC